VCDLSKNLIFFLIQTDSTCTASTNKPGICVPISDCDSKIPVFLQSPQTSSDMLYIDKSICGHNNKTQLICCEERVMYQPAPPFSYPYPPKYAEETTWLIETETPKTGTSKKLLPYLGDCGKAGSSERIIGGSETGIDEFPWMALVRYENGYSYLSLQTYLF
jgi:hypothetical protein